MPLGLYISVPFCRTKCSYCNFASDVFSRAVHKTYIDRVCDDIHHSREIASQAGGLIEPSLDTIYLGGGTPTLLDLDQLERLFVTIRSNFILEPETEITVECAPGTLTSAVIETFLHCGVNRVSLGVQSFVDQEAASVGRLHKRTTVIDDVSRLREAGISNINIDLIAGLPHQTMESWQFSLREALDSGVPHVSIYLLEVDEDSRLGRELIAGGNRYHAHFVPEEDQCADFYELACDELERAGIQQYEISNFARAGFQSRHNLKYWTRQPYLGFGVDAHSMLLAGETTSCDGNSTQPKTEIEAVRFSTSDSLERYIAKDPLNVTPVSRQAALEEMFFLGLRLNSGIDMESVTQIFGPQALNDFADVIEEATVAGLMKRDASRLYLTNRGRLLSNEVFEKFISIPALP